MAASRTRVWQARPSAAKPTSKSAPQQAASWLVWQRRDSKAASNALAFPACAAQVRARTTRGAVRRLAGRVGAIGVSRAASRLLELATKDDQAESLFEELNFF